MKKTFVLISAVLLFASLTFAQTPKAQDKTTPAPKATTTAPAKDSKAGCDKKDMEKCNHKAGKSCCAKDAKKGTDTKAPEKK